jgi:hypothetical protein
MLHCPPVHLTSHEKAVVYLVGSRGCHALHCAPACTCRVRLGRSRPEQLSA